MQHILGYVDEICWTSFLMLNFHKSLEIQIYADFHSLKKQSIGSLYHNLLIYKLSTVWWNLYTGVDKHLNALEYL